MEKRKFKIGEIVYWQEVQGEVIKTSYYDSDYPVNVKFSNGWLFDFTDDGRHHVNALPVLSYEPYKNEVNKNEVIENDFTQYKIIQKDTLVFVKHHKEYEWLMKYYSHFENGKHYCFKIQYTSKETNETTSWNYVETENPLINNL